MLIADARYGAAPIADEMVRETAVTVPAEVAAAAAAAAAVPAAPAALEVPSRTPFWLLVAFAVGYLIGRS